MSDRTDAAPTLIALGDASAVVCEGDVCFVPGSALDSTEQAALAPQEARPTPAR